MRVVLVFNLLLLSTASQTTDTVPTTTTTTTTNTATEQTCKGKPNDRRTFRVPGRSSLMFFFSLALRFPPANVSVRVLNSTSLRVSWDPPLALNGITVNYTVVYAAGITYRSKLVSGGILSLTLTGLNEFTRYNVSVSAFTLGSIGPESSPISVITDEDG